MDGSIHRIERTGPQPAARVRRVERGEREAFTLDDVGDEPTGERSGEHGDGDGDEETRDERPIAPRGDDESGGRIDLTA